MENETQENGYVPPPRLADLGGTARACSRQLPL